MLLHLNYTQSKELAAGGGGGYMALAVIEDVSCILSGPQSCCTAPQALSDLHRLLSSAASQLHSVKGKKSFHTQCVAVPFGPCIYVRRKVRIRTILGFSCAN